MDGWIGGIPRNGTLTHNRKLDPETERKGRHAENQVRITNTGKDPAFAPSPHVTKMVKTLNKHGTNSDEAK